MIRVEWLAPPGADTALEESSWTVLGARVELVTDTRTAVRESPLPALERHGGADVVSVAADTWEQARGHVVPLVLSLVAHRQGLLHLRGSIGYSSDGVVGGLLTIGGGQPVPGGGVPNGPHLLVDASGTLLSLTPVGSGVLGPGHHEAVGSAVPVTGVRLAGGDNCPYLLPKAAATLLRAAVGLDPSHLATCSAGAGGLALFVEIETARERRIGDMAALLPVGHLPAPRAYTEAGLEHLRAIQRTALDVYGRLEPERAVSWAAEEFGEVAQAIRRRESPGRLSEELGQFFSWVLCLANICGIDMAEAADRALRHEALRQVAAYGALRPYVPTTTFRSSP